jgi:hypothetical protein
MESRTDRYPKLKKTGLVVFSTLFLVAALGAEPTKGPPSSQQYGYGEGKINSVHMVKLEVVGQKHKGEWEVAELREPQKSEVVRFADTLSCLQGGESVKFSKRCTRGP